MEQSDTGQKPDQDPELVKELQRDLGRIYYTHGAMIEEVWRSLSKGQRARVIKSAAADGAVLNHPRDPSMGSLYKIIPEWNLQDLVDGEPEFLLNMLKYRATKSIFAQYSAGQNGGPGDAAFIKESMRVNNLRHARPFKDRFTFFLNEDEYGNSVEIKDKSKEREIRGHLEAGFCVPQSTGELILERQQCLLQALSLLVQDILNMGSRSRRSAKRPNRADDAPRADSSAISTPQKLEKFSPQDLLSIALGQKDACEDYLDLCRTEPRFLENEVNTWFFSRPELVPDENEQIMPETTDRDVSIAFFEVMHNAVAAVAVWDYLCRLIQSLNEKGSDDRLYRNRSEDRLYRNVLLQELSNVCHWEYTRNQKLFKRHVQIMSGANYFSRVAGDYENATPRVAMKAKAEALTRDNPQLHYMLRLCQPDTDVIRAVELIKKVDEIHRNQSAERDMMMEREFETFGDLALVTWFVQNLSKTFLLPPYNLKKGQTYLPRLKALKAELESLKTQIDLADFADPTSSQHLLEPGMAEKALKKLDRFIIEKTGTKIGFLYEDITAASVSELKDILQWQKAKIAKDSQTDFRPPIFQPPAPAVRLEQRRQKNKSRRGHPSMYAILPAPPSHMKPETVPTMPIIRVKDNNTFHVLFQLFQKSESRGSSISWSAFEAAMADLKFSVIPRFGPVFTFSPPQVLRVQKSLTVHRPFQSRIEGNTLLFLVRRLKRAYGWGNQSFVKVRA